MSSIFENGEGLLLSVSGGKDSTAMILYMKEIAIDQDKLEYVFMDTGWESVETYSYLDYLESNLDIKINRIRAKVKIKDEHEDIYRTCLNLMGREHSSFVATILNKTMFPAGAFQWCTSILKIDPFKLFLNELDYQPISCVGIRRAESKRRSNYSECFPCIRSNKKEMKEFINTEKHIEVIRILERYNSNIKGRQVTFFKGGPIDEILNWSKTSRGGKQYFLFDTEQPTCEKWGMCGI